MTRKVSIFLGGTGANNVVDALSNLGAANAAAYVQANTARDSANAAYNQANTAGGNSGAAYDQANTARDTANGAYAQANGAYGQANDAYNQANTARDTANGAYNQANGAYDAANNAKVTVFANSGAANVTTQVINLVNTSTILVSVANTSGNANITLDLVGTPYDQANSARDQANTARNTANDAYGGANTANTNALNSYAQANTARDTANDAYTAANNAKVTVFANSGAANATTQTINFVNTSSILVTVANTSGNANIEMSLIGTPYDQANTARDTANDAYSQANTAYGAANGAYDQANSAYVQANTARDTANLSYAQANTARNTANDSYSQANTARGTANDAYGQANTARDQANNAYAEANLKLNLTGGTITGDVILNGNLFVNGVETIVNTESLTINDPIFLLANNNTTNSVGLGFTAHYGPTQQHTGLIRAHQDNIWYLFEDYDEHILYANNVLDTGNIKLATLKANINANSLLLVGETVATQANLTLAHDQANNARNQANTARTTANDAYTQANTARDTGNNAYGQANNARDQANTARNTGNAAYGQANTARDQANTARNTANAAYGQANNAYAEANLKLNLSGGTVTGDVTFNGNVNLAANSTFRSNTVATVTQDVEVTVDAFATAAYRSALYQAQLTRTSPANDYETITLSVVHDGTTVYLSQYGQNKTNASANMGTFDASIATGTLSLTFKPNVAVVTVKTHRNAITV